jgi:hypothetical protein
LDEICVLRSLELPRLSALHPGFPVLSDLCVRCAGLGALRVAKNEREESLVCFWGCFGDGGYWGMAVRPGVLGSAAVSGETGKIGLVDLLLRSCVTGRMVVPLVKGELEEEDLGERGVRGLGPSELWAPGDSGEEIFGFECRVRELRSKFGTADFRNGILGANRGSTGGGSEHVTPGWRGRRGESVSQVGV